MIMRLMDNLSTWAHCENDVDGALDMYGHSLAHLVVELCELALNLVCWDKASPQGGLKFPSLKELTGKKSGYDRVFDPVVILIAKELMKIKGKIDREPTTPDIGLFAERFKFAKLFIERMIPFCEESRCFTEHILDIFNRVERNVFEGLGFPVWEYSKENLGFVVLKKDEDEYTDEELDKIYSIKKTNSDKRIAPVYIMEFMMINSSRKNRYGINDIINMLGEQYDVFMERKAVSRMLTQLQEADYLCVMENESGYWYDADLVRERISGTW